MQEAETKMKAEDIVKTQTEKIEQRSADLKQTIPETNSQRSLHQNNPTHAFHVKEVYVRW